MSPNSPLIAPVGMRPCNIGNLLVVPVPASLDTAPDGAKPVYAVMITVEQHMLQLAQISQNVMSMCVMLNELIQRVKPGLVAEIMAENLLTPEPHREALIQALKSLEEAAAEQREFVTRLAAQQQQQQAEPPTA